MIKENDMSIKGVIDKITGKKPKKEEDAKSEKKPHRHHSKKDVTGDNKKEGHHHHHHHHHKSSKSTEKIASTPKETSMPVGESTNDDAAIKTGVGTLFTVVELLHEQNPKKAEHAHDLLEKHHSAELIFSGEGKDAHGLHGRLVPPHSMTVTSQGIHYLTTDEAVAKMDEQESVGKLPKTRAVVVEQESVGKRPKI
jgi:hypothetical protein